MSGSISKAVFNDGYELFTVGDESVLRMRRLQGPAVAAVTQETMVAQVVIDIGDHHIEHHPATQGLGVDAGLGAVLGQDIDHLRIRQP